MNNYLPSLYRTAAMQHHPQQQQSLSSSSASSHNPVQLSPQRPVPIMQTFGTITTAPQSLLPTTTTPLNNNNNGMTSVAECLAQWKAQLEQAQKQTHKMCNESQSDARRVCSDMFAQLKKQFEEQTKLERKQQEEHTQKETKQVEVRLQRNEQRLGDLERKQQETDTKQMETRLQENEQRLVEMEGKYNQLLQVLHEQLPLISTLSQDVSIIRKEAAAEAENRRALSSTIKIPDLLSRLPNLQKPNQQRSSSSASSVSAPANSSCNNNEVGFTSALIPPLPEQQPPQLSPLRQGKKRKTRLEEDEETTDKEEEESSASDSNEEDDTESSDDGKDEKTKPRKKSSPGKQVGGCLFFDERGYLITKAVPISDRLFSVSIYRSDPTTTNDSERPINGMQCRLPFLTKSSANALPTWEQHTVKCIAPLIFAQCAMSCYEDAQETNVCCKNLSARTLTKWVR